MERRHQVFVSSTYEDLVQARQQVIHALLELDCIPAGMELFPAADEDSWSLIREVIDDSDYYIVIIGGRYGSVDADGKSFTEKEYDYAISSGKPVLAFIHEEPGKLACDLTEPTEQGRERLRLFREKTQKRQCKYWKNSDDLGGKVSRSIVQLRKRHPSDGWVPGRYAADQKLLREMETLRSRVAELQSLSQSGPPPDIEELSHGDDTFSLMFDLIKTQGGSKEEVKVTISWNTLFLYVGPSLMGECDEERLDNRIRLAFWHTVPRNLHPLNSFSSIIIPYVAFDHIKVQLQAIGLMSYGSKKRTVADKSIYWGLTPHGRQYLLKLRALKRSGRPQNLPVKSETDAHEHGDDDANAEDT